MYNRESLTKLIEVIPVIWWQQKKDMVLFFRKNFECPILSHDEVHNCTHIFIKLLKQISGVTHCFGGWAQVTAPAAGRWPCLDVPRCRQQLRPGGFQAEAPEVPVVRRGDSPRWNGFRPELCGDFQCEKFFCVFETRKIKEVLLIWLPPRPASGSPGQTGQTPSTKRKW